MPICIPHIDVLDLTFIHKHVHTQYTHTIYAHNIHTGVSSSRTTDVLQLPGTHITPCGGDLTSVQGVPLLQPLASGAQGDIRRLVGCMTRWLDDTIQVHDTTSA